ncbi:MULTISPECIES: beta-ketoacyl synthase N-terminal-like domain-containing protein [unclassified Streptomyces]|uniref:beta-ketoacyl [acyl carrier protein] synthase domain-containing protein n=1 Tax=unclassified Streptomyces TaxID=2593676 RepID=UPI002DDA8CBB|nr:beta-ketoacyl synthase N-terminal-like domain-containing protein [Streptomyces sp. NBC_01750]WSA98273.1 polyketide synthase [Streptomyces sp. NBC_01794]WSD37190.1 polyketide synthase [Streptomyces sp. NBC_01750]
MNEREILTRFKAGTLNRGQATQLLADLAARETVPPAGERGTRPNGTAVGGTADAADLTAPMAPVAPAAPSPGAVSADEDRIAVVGIAGRYPHAPDLDAFWSNVREGRDTSSAAPVGRPCGSPLHADERGHFLHSAAEFDAAFFGLDEHEAALTDPQERLFVETAWEALEDGGCTGTRLDALTGPHGEPRHVGVFVGVSAADYGLLAAELWAEGHREMPRSGHWSLPGRLAGLLGLRGPGQAVDTADSSALVALHLAVGALRRGECTAALAGGVELLLHPSRGRAGAGEGVGVVLLKPLARALADGDRIHAVVCESWTGHSFAGPPGRDRAATGCALHESRHSAARSVGEAGAATGFAALTRAVLQMRYGTTAPGPDGAGPLSWPRSQDGEGRELPRRAEVEVSGAGVLDAGAVIEEFLPREYNEPGEPGARPAGPAPAWDDTVERDELVLLSAPTPRHLAATAARLADWLSAGYTEADCSSEGVTVDLGSVARTLRAGRAALPCRIALTVRDLPGLVAVLEDFVRDPAAVTATAATDGPLRFADLRTSRADPLGLGAAPETRDYLAALWRGGRVEQLAQLWLSGVEVDWAALENRPEGRALVVSLPASAFLRRPLWLGYKDRTREKTAERGR